MLFKLRRVKLYLGLILGLTLLFCFVSSIAEAHRPAFPDGLNKSANTAFQLDDIDISQAIYQVLDEEEQVWLSFYPEQSSTQVAIIQLGIPVLEETKSFRPKVALISPSLEKIDLPFEIPAGFGAIVYESEDGNAIREFHEPFTNTKSWILIEDQFEIVENGIHYVVIFSDTNQSGKFWFATGTKEVFDFSARSELNENISKVKSFHLPSVVLPTSTKVPRKDISKQTDTASESDEQKLESNERNYFKSTNGYLIGGVVVLIIVMVFVRRRFT
ncbi:MAG: hypothetical protein MK362_03775 [SAR202 cluster bacterium]|nr:hypothetical protein [SAR202 cluster bacterium]